MADDAAKRDPSMKVSVTQCLTRTEKSNSQKSMWERAAMFTIGSHGMDVMVIDYMRNDERKRRKDIFSLAA